MDDFGLDDILAEVAGKSPPKNKQDVVVPAPKEAVQNNTASKPPTISKAKKTSRTKRKKGSQKEWKERTHSVVEVDRQIIGIVKILLPQYSIKESVEFVLQAWIKKNQSKLSSIINNI